MITHPHVLDTLDYLTRDFGKTMRSIRVDGARVYSQDDTGEDVTFTYLNEGRHAIKDRERSEIRSEALNRGLYIR